MKNTLSSLKNKLNNLRRFVRHGVYNNSMVKKIITDQFHKLYYSCHTYNEALGKAFWLGAPTQKCPLDVWIYQEIIFETKPDLIIECGTADGGSALFLASICDLVNKGEIITIDIKNKERPQHKRIKYLLGSSTSEEIVGQVKQAIDGLPGDKNKVMIILDSDHRKKHVLDELRIYSKFVTKGCYLIVEDTNINGHPVAPEFGPGPMEALEEFLNENKNFIADASKEKLFLTFNPKGYLTSPES